MKGIGDRDFEIIQVKGELKPWKWMSSLKEKLDSKKNERAIAEHGEIFPIIMQAEKKNLMGKQSLKRKDDKTYQIIGSNLLTFLNMEKKKDKYA